MRNIKVIMTLAALLAMLAGYGDAYALNRFNTVIPENSSDRFNLRFDFEKTPKAKMTLLKKSIQIEVKDAFSVPSKNTIEVNEGGVKEIQVYQYNSRTLRIRIFPQGKLSDISKDFSLDTVENSLVARFSFAVGSLEATDKELTETASKASKTTTDRTTALAVEPKPLTPFMKKAEKNIEDTILDDAEPLNLTASTAGSDEIPGFLKYSEPTVPAVPSVGSSVVKVVSALAIVLSLVLLTGWAARKYLGSVDGRLGSKDDVKVLSNHFIGVKKNVTIIEVAGEILVLGVTNSNINLLAKYDDPEKIEQIRLGNRLPQKPIGLAKKIPGIKWGVSAKEKISQKFANEMKSRKKEMEKASLSQKEAIKKEKKEKAKLTREQLAKTMSNDIMTRIKAMQEATV